VQFNDVLKLLEVTLDAVLSFDKHVSNVVRVCRPRNARVTAHSSAAEV